MDGPLVLTTTEWIAVKHVTDFSGPQKMNTNDFADPQTLRWSHKDIHMT